VFLYRSSPFIRGILRKNTHIEGGVLEIFCKENHFSEEKSHELSQVGRALTTHLCRLWEGGQIKTHNKEVRNDFNFNWRPYN
jgi:hypothetical protein